MQPPPTAPCTPATNLYAPKALRPEALQLAALKAAVTVLSQEVGTYRQSRLPCQLPPHRWPR